MLKPWNRFRSKLDTFQISIQYMSPIHVKICFQLIIGIPNDRFLSIFSLKFYMLSCFLHRLSHYIPLGLGTPIIRVEDGAPISYTSLFPYLGRNYVLNLFSCRVLFFMVENDRIILSFGLGQEGKEY